MALIDWQGTTCLLNLPKRPDCINELYNAIRQMVKALNASDERERDKAIQEIEALLDDYSNQYEAMHGSLSTQ